MGSKQKLEVKGNKRRKGLTMRQSDRGVWLCQIVAISGRHALQNKQIKAAISIVLWISANTHTP